MTAVRTGDEVTFVVGGAEIVRPEGCHAEEEQACIGAVQVRPLGCDERKSERVPLALGPETSWTVDLEAGAYELDVFGYFESSEGATGDVSGSLGLLIEPVSRPRTVPVDRDLAVCPFAD